MLIYYSTSIFPYQYLHSHLKLKYPYFLQYFYTPLLIHLYHHPIHHLVTIDLNAPIL